MLEHVFVKVQIAVNQVGIKKSTIICKSGV